MLGSFFIGLAVGAVSFVIGLAVGYILHRLLRI